MAKPVFATGDIPSASQINDWFVNSLFARKTADESVTSSTTFQNDDHLVLSVAANASYELTLFMRYDGATGGDVNLQIALPSGATFRGALTRLFTTATVSTDVSLAYIEEFGSDGLGALGAGTPAAAILQGLVVVGSTAGTCQLKWAQLTSSATASRMLAGSYMRLVRVD